MKKKDLIENYQTIGQLTVDILDFTKIFEHADSETKILIMKNLFCFLDFFKKTTQTEEIVNQAKEWCDKATKRNPTSPSLYRYDFFLFAVQELASEKKNPEKIPLISSCLDDAKAILKEEILDLSQGQKIFLNR